MFILHGKNGRTGDQHLEVHFHGVGVLGDEVHLVAHLAGDLVGNVHQQGVIGDVAVVQGGLLVVEQELVHTGEVVTHQADAVAHIGAGEQGVCSCGLHRAYIVHGGFTVGEAETVRFILTRSEAHSGHQSGCSVNAYLGNDIFHCFVC